MFFIGNKLYFYIQTNKLTQIIPDMLKLIIAILVLFGMYNPAALAQNLNITDNSQLQNSLNKFIGNHINNSSFILKTGYNKTDSTTIDSINIDKKNRTINVYFDASLSYAPFREDLVEDIKTNLKNVFDKQYKKYKVNLYSNGSNIQSYIPNYYRAKKRDADKTRAFGKLDRKTRPIVQNISKPNNQTLSLYNINIALWHSHGWYYESTLNRWEWQRARLFNTVEDLFPMIFTMNYLVPMLENAGANIFIPRERSWQINEVIVDNDTSSLSSIFKTDISYTQIDSGFAIGNPPYTNENPFKLGTATKFISAKNNLKTMQWIPDIPENGYYPVYVSYKSVKNSTNTAHYKVYHLGGVTEFLVNQQIGSGTWVYLGNFKFKKGVNPENGKVELLNTCKKTGQTITADAVRFGGGMGNISRNGLVSNRPRYQEGARYYLQYAGFPDTLVWKHYKNNDYADDRQSRGEWVNYLIGAPSGPEKAPNAKGLGIPIDMTLAFHTDAGITNNDTVIGTLGIYSSKNEGAALPNGISKMASRDLTDIIQTQIVNDIRLKYDPAWTRRPMWNREYSETRRPNTPTMLLELLSHQNFIDVRFGKEPAFQFDVGRAVYKGILKFMNTFYGIEYVVQPLPVTHFQTGLTQDGGIKLKWQPQTDPLEPTALPKKYTIYTKLDNRGFDNGTVVESTEFNLPNIKQNVIYSFKVTATNNGGESFPSEELSVCSISNAADTVLIINAFDRLGGAAFFNDENHAGFLNNIDNGVPYMYDFSTTGAQYDFNKNSPWLDDDSPGFGASYADMEDKVIPGNTFNFSFTHGQSIKNAGFAFVSVSDEAVIADNFDITKYKIIDFLAGEEKTTFLPKNDSVPHYQIFTDDIIYKLKKYLNNGGSLFVSGAHIAGDAHFNKQDSIIGALLKFKWRTGNASRKGNFYFSDADFLNNKKQFRFNTTYNKKIYTVESADALEPIDTTAVTLLQYSENNMSAGVIYNGRYKIVALGFPFETIINKNERDLIMKKILENLIQKKIN